MKWYVYENRFHSGKLSSFAIIPEDVYQNRMHKDIYDGPYTEEEAEQIAKDLQAEWESQQQ